MRARNSAELGAVRVASVARMWMFAAGTSKSEQVRWKCVRWAMTLVMVGSGMAWRGVLGLGWSGYWAS